MPASNTDPHAESGPVYHGVYVPRPSRSESNYWGFHSHLVLTCRVRPLEEREPRFD